jgi:uracil phosphoribosyltransferase
MASDHPNEPSPTLHVSGHPLIRHKATLLSDERTDTRMFRELVRELTSLLMYEAMQDVPTRTFTYQTPLEESTGYALEPRIGLVPIIRAGLGMVDAAADIIPHSEVWHLGMYRDEQTHSPVSYYNRLPKECPDDLVILLDPMLATGGSARDAVTVLKNWGAKWVKFVGIIAAPEGVREMQEHHPDVDLYVATLDRELDENRFIRPGLGDAGDRLFGTVKQD